MPRENTLIEHYTAIPVEKAMRLASKILDVMPRLLSFNDRLDLVDFHEMLVGDISITVDAIKRNEKRVVPSWAFPEMDISRMVFLGLTEAQLVLLELVGEKPNRHGNMPEYPGFAFVKGMTPGNDEDQGPYKPPYDSQKYSHGVLAA